MNALARFDSESGIELVINTTSGEAYATINGYCRMSGRAKSTISERVGTVRFEGLKMAEIDTPQGLRTVRLIPAETVFEWLIKDSPDLALEMGKVGATVYLHKLAGFKVSSEAIEPRKAQLELPPPHVQVAKLYEALTGFGIKLDNPRIQQPIQDLALNILGVSGGQCYLKSEIWVGVAERAEQLDYPIALITKKRSQLGKFVKSFDLESKQETRLVNGTQRPVWVYRQCGQLDQAIHQFFNPEAY